jgi:amino acid adenylation domain-containing protein
MENSMNISAFSNKMNIAASHNIQERDYWLNKLSGELIKNFFPFDHQETSLEDRHLDTVNFQFQGELFTNLIRFGNNSDNRLHMILAAGLVALLNKYTGEEDIIVGMPLYKQDIKGEFINTLVPLRNQLEPNMTFKQLLIQMRQTIFEAVEHQNYPTAILMEKLKIPYQDNTGFGLFDVAVLLENIHEKYYLKDINCNIVFSFLRIAEGIESELKYNAAWYDKTTIKRIARHYRHLFRVVFSNPDIPLAEIDILTEEEKNQILLDFNDTRVEYPKDQTIHVWLENQVEKIPDKIALVYNHQCLTYQGLNETANQLAGLLREKSVKPGSIIGIIMEPCLEMIIGIAGILKAGGSYLPIDTGYPERRVLSILRDSGVSILLTKEINIKDRVFTALKNIREGQAEPVVTAPRGQIMDFDSLPKPDRTLVNYEKIHQSIGLGMAKHTVSLQATRGCPFNCAFCHKIWPKKHVTRSAEHIFEEIRACYDAGVSRFVFVDDILNFDKQNSSKIFQYIIKQGLDVQLFFPNGLRSDILTRDYIDLMVEAGTVSLAFALETASPRLQKLIRKNLDIPKMKENILYFCQKYPHVSLELFTMLGFPTETEEEAFMTLDFVKEIKWLHFPYLNILIIFPNTDMEKLALEHGVPKRAVDQSVNLAYHQLPETLPFPKSFTLKYQVDFLNNYFLSKERLLHVLPYQTKFFTEDELVQKYNSYLPTEIKRFDDILNYAGISRDALGDLEFLPPHYKAAPGFREKMAIHFPAGKRNKTGEDPALRILLLDLSLLFSEHSAGMLFDMVEEPLGLMALMSFLNEKFADRICGKVAKSRIDFDRFDQLKTIISDFKPDLIGIRTLSFYKSFFHHCVSVIRQWGEEVPIIAGGPYATSDYMLILQDFNLDLAVLGEGELTLAKLVEEMMKNNKKLPDEEVLKNIPGIAFIKKEDKALLRETSRDIVFLDNIREMAAPYPRGNPLHVNQPGDLLYLISTSGSTGIPKSIMMEHRNLVNLLNFQLYETAVDFKRVLQFASIGFDVSFQEIFSTLLAGGELYLIDRDTKQDVYRLLELIDRNQINVLYWPPAYLKYIFSEEMHRARFPKSVQHIITAGEQLIITKSLREYIKKAGIYVHNHYGPAETHVVTSLVLEPTGKIPELPPIGKPIDNTLIYILDENKNLKPIGTIGELYIAGSNLGRGYHRREELTARKFIPNPFVEGQFMYRSGDLARWLPDGNIEFIGRADHQVKIRGFRIELGEIETRLMEIDFIKEAVIVDYKDPDGEKYLCAYFVSQKEVEVSEIKDILASDLADYMVPLYFVPLEKIPLTSNGKVDKKKLPLPEFKTNEIHVGPRNDVEMKLMAIWSDILGIDKGIGIDANFFEWGGHSLKATILITRIHQIFDVKLSLGEMFDQPTIRGLAALITESAADTFSSIEPVEKKEYYPLFSAQKRLYILQQMDPDSIAYNLPRVVMLEGEVEIGRLEKAFQELINRHESLRTSFHLIQNVPIQKTHQEVSVPLAYWEMEEEAARNKVRTFIAHFDLKKAPLLRVGLIKIGAHTHILMVDLHHIITDGISNNVLLQDFNALYNGEGLAAIKLHYKDFSQWQNSAKEQQASQRQQEFWLQQFPGEPPVLNLPTDFPRARVQSFEGSSISFRIGKKNHHALRTLALKYDATLYMVLLALFNILLAKITSQEDIIIGTPVAGRRHKGLEKITGMFVNTLALRNFPTGARRVSAFLTDLRKRTLDAFDNQEYPFEELVEHVVVNRDLSRNPLFDTMFALHTVESQPADEPGKGLAGFNIKPFRHESRINKFNLSLNATLGETLSLSFGYSTKLFKHETMERFITYFKTIMSAVLKDEMKKIAQIEIVSVEEKRLLLADFNTSAADIPKKKTIHELFEQQARKFPGELALAFNEESLTYKELSKRSNQLGNLLISKGVKTDTIVGIMLERSLEMIIGILAILIAGGAYMPIDPVYPEERIRYMLKDSNANVLVTTSTLSKDRKVGRWEDEKIFLDYLNKLSISSFCFAAKKQAAIRNVKLKIHKPQPAARSSQLAYIIYTSGSTGEPKGVLVQHGSVVRLVKNSNYIHFNQDDRLLLTGNMVFDVTTFEIWGPLLNGVTLYLTNEDVILNIEKLEKTLVDNGITVLHLIPQLFNQLAAQNMGIFRRLRVLLLGGDVVRPEYVNQVSHRFKELEILHMYGPTENTTFSTFFSVERVFEKTIPIGRPVSNSSVFIIDKYGKLQPGCLPGELYTGGEGVARGYLNKPELTKEKFIENPFKARERIYKTGDLASWQPGGNIEFLGRTDNQVKIRGIRIECAEIERQLLKIEKIIRAVVIRQEDDKDDQSCLSAYVVSNQEVQVSELREYLSRQVPAYMVPAHFVQIEDIPLTSNGKIDRKALALQGGKLLTNVEYKAPQGERQQLIAGIWQEILNLEEIGIHDNFFQCGGNSLKILQLNSRLKETLGMQINLVTLFEYPTVDSLARYLENHETGSVSPHSEIAADAARKNERKEGKERLKQRMQKRAKNMNC